AGDVGRVLAARQAHDRMAGEVVDDSQRATVGPVEAEQADLRIDRADLPHLLVGRQRVGVAGAGPPAALPLASAVLPDAVLAAGAGPDRHGDQVGRRLLDRLEGALGDVGAGRGVAVARVDENVAGLDAQFLAYARTHLAEEVVTEVADLADGDHVEG